MGDGVVIHSVGLTHVRPECGKGTWMRHLLMRVTLAVTAATIISPVQAQISSPAAAPPPRPPATYSGSSFPYPFPAPTPEDAYREGLINRWNYEQLVGPLPTAMQGPSPDGNRGGGGGDARGN
jgi:hypothetical protein